MITHDTDIEEYINSLPIKEKGYVINEDKLEDPWHYVDLYCHAEDSNKAKNILWKKYCSSHDLDMVRFNDHSAYLTFLNLPVRRSYEYDKLEFEGEILGKTKIRDKIKTIQHNLYLDNILNDESIRFVFIEKNGGYYGPKYKGYVSKWELLEAGTYPKEEAVKHARGVESIRLIKIDVEEYNNDIIEKRKQLLEKIIKE